MSSLPQVVQGICQHHRSREARMQRASNVRPDPDGAVLTERMSRLVRGRLVYAARHLERASYAPKTFWDPYCCSAQGSQHVARGISRPLRLRQELHV